MGILRHKIYDHLRRVCRERPAHRPETGSRAEQDVMRAYKAHANCYITKPVHFRQFVKVVQSVEAFWLTIGASALQ